MNRDLRRYAKQTNLHLLLGFILVLFLIGDGLIFLFYGRNAALMGLICLVGAFVPVGLILFALWVIDWVARKNRVD